MSTDAWFREFERGEGERMTRREEAQDRLEQFRKRLEQFRKDNPPAEMPLVPHWDEKKATLIPTYREKEDDEEYVLVDNLTDMKLLIINVMGYSSLQVFREETGVDPLSLLGKFWCTDGKSVDIWEDVQLTTFYIVYTGDGETYECFRCQADNEDDAKEQFQNAEADQTIAFIHYLEDEDEDEEDEDEPPILYLEGSVFVNTYLVDRVYGGPEEGGWYYELGLPVGSAQATDETLLETLLKARGWAEEENRHRRADINSVLSQGRYDVRVQSHPARGWPAEPPHYE